MKLPLGWLADFVSADLTAEDLAERLADSGTAVEGIESPRVDPSGGNLEHFRVGHVVSAEQHPNADRLRVCMVDVGEDAPRQIVCGAPNAREGLDVAVALPGAVLPGREALGTAKLRGVESSGMLCSESELGLSTDHGGIAELHTDAAPGTPLHQVMPIVETVLDLEITSNRPDCLAVYGLAREVHAVTGAPLAPLDESDPPAEGEGTVEDHAALQVDAPDLCPRYMARVFTDVAVGPSPAWLRARLAAAGMRSISNVVDVTNYVMLLTGQPLHAFDLDQLAGARVVVRRARDGEPITTLDGQKRTLDSGILAICDAERPAVIAGIMGAADSEVSDGTTRVLLEAATFDGPAVMNASLRLGLRSESSSRLEKGLPVELPERAMRIASRMLVDLCGARLVPGTLDARAGAFPDAPVIHLRMARVNALLGIDIPAGEARATLERLGFGVADTDDGFDVTVPFERRRDVTREADLIEEVGRVHGYADVPVLLPRLLGDGRRTPAQRLERDLTRRAADLGLHEVVTYRFVPEADADMLQMAGDDPRRDVLRLSNALSEEMAVMRRSMLPGLLRAAARNQRHQRMSGGLFEIGRTYAPAAELADERRFLAALRFGPSEHAHWRGEAPPNDVFRGLGVARALCRVAGVRPDASPNQAPYFHPVRQARLTAGTEVVGWVGEMHPRVLAAFDVQGPATAIVLDLDALARSAPTQAVQYEDLLSVPVSTRDLAVVVERSTPAAELLSTVREAGGDLVRGAAVFDRYEGEQVGEGKVSLALRLTIADPGRTLTDDEIQAAVDRAREALAERHGAVLRA